MDSGAAVNESKTHLLFRQQWAAALHKSHINARYVSALRVRHTQRLNAHSTLMLTGGVRWAPSTRRTYAAAQWRWQYERIRGEWGGARWSDGPERLGAQKTAYTRLAFATAGSPRITWRVRQSRRASSMGLRLDAWPIQQMVRAGLGLEQMGSRRPWVWAQLAVERPMGWGALRAAVVLCRPPRISSGALRLGGVWGRARVDTGLRILQSSTGLPRKTYRLGVAFALRPQHRVVYEHFLQEQGRRSFRVGAEVSTMRWGARLCLSAMYASGDRLRSPAAVKLHFNVSLGVQMRPSLSP